MHVHINMVVGEGGGGGEEESLLLCTYVHTRRSTICITISCGIYIL